MSCSHPRHGPSLSLPRSLIRSAALLSTLPLPSLSHDGPEEILENLLISRRVLVGEFPGTMYLPCCAGDERILVSMPSSTSASVPQLLHRISLTKVVASLTLAKLPLNHTASWLPRNLPRDSVNRLPPSRRLFASPRLLLPAAAFLCEAVECTLV